MTRKQRHAILIAGGLAMIGISIAPAMGEEPAISKAPVTPAVVQAPPLDAMVERLEARLKQNGADLNGWVMLVRSYSFLKQPAKTQETLDKARKQFASEPEALKQIEALAVELGTPAADGKGEQPKP
jgi:cytochrome c-type biogenesis protein CcmH